MTRRWYRPTYAEECAAFNAATRPPRMPRPWRGAIVLVLAIAAVLWLVLR